MYNSSVIWQKGESQNGGNKNTKYVKYPKNERFLPRYAHVRGKKFLILFEILPFAILPTSFSTQKISQLLSEHFFVLNTSITRNAVPCNNCDNLANLSFILEIFIFSEAYLKPSRTSMMKLFAKIAVNYFSEKALG